VSAEAKALAKRLSELHEEERLQDTTTGAYLGVKATHPITKELLPVYVASYVSENHSAAVMGVPAHDQRDWNFAKAHNLPVKFVVKPAESDQLRNNTTKFLLFWVFFRD